jgi:hypothetical protein
MAYNGCNYIDIYIHTYIHCMHMAVSCVGKVFFLTFQIVCMQVNDVTVEVVEGDGRNVLCEAVERHHASILVVGSHGYGAIKRY